MKEPKDSLANAIRLHQAGRLREAINLYTALLEGGHDEAFVRYLLGTARVQAGVPEAGLAELQSSIELDPENPDALNSHGNALFALERPSEALESYERAISRRPGYAEAQFNRANCLGRLGRHREAILGFDGVLALDPDHADAAVNRGLTLHALGRYEEALASYDRAIAIDPEDAIAHYNRANSLKALRRLEEALAVYDQTVPRLNDLARLHNNRGNTLHALGRYDEALVSFDRAIKLDPADDNAPWNKSLVLLLLGRYKEGWPLYERRPSKFEARRPECDGKPAWRGEPWIRGRRLLVHAEQGYGDCIQALRYLSRVHALGAEILLEVPPPLVGIVSSLRCPVTVVLRGDAPPAFDACCPIMSLPGAFETTIEDIPAVTPYLFSVEDKVRAWRNRLGPPRAFRIGLVWSGSPGHPDDQDRSIPLALLAPLTRLPSTEWHALQKDIRPEDLEALQRHPEIRRHDDALMDFSDTAALIECMDLVISVDTSVAHLSGALGKKVWILLPFVPDFRWLLERRDSPWYPSARLYRQHARHDWGGVIEALERDLGNFCSAASRAGTTRAGYMDS